MKFQVIVFNGTNSANYQDREHVADFRHKHHAIGFAKKLLVHAYVVDCFDDTTVYCNKE